MHFGRHRRNITLLNVTPLIDVVFILLVFFMLTTNFARFRLIGVETPQDREVVEDPTAAIVILVKANGDLEYDGDPMSRAAIRDNVEAMVSVDPGRTFLVRPELGVTVQEAVDIFQLTRDSGAYSVSFAGSGEDGA
ncbi:biopolymer transporter ExbD [Parasphingopyxis sp.]|uniref:ExbD/TolR family protein n=1 Tax=Parasphingopyxis sp. TaxID=1920299 RepID=UPI00260C2B75|nr:biopolymer transporter ExbD [Parasphingopyxis sp.]